MRFDLGTVDALISTDLARDFRDIGTKVQRVSIYVVCFKNLGPNRYILEPTKQQKLQQQ